MNLNGVQSVYFIGIGGSSMSSLAEILHRRGFRVAGSDMQESATTAHLRQTGIRVYLGHNAENLKAEKPDAVVKTEAIMPGNPEWLYAQQAGLPVYRRAELLGFLLDGYRHTVGVAGTNGKTTTTSMITSVYLASGRDFSSIIGGHMKQIDASYCIGKTDEVCIFESCEFRDSFLQFRPSVSVILNIDEDHMEYFKTRENLIASFRRYLNNTREGGVVIYNAEDENSLQMIRTYPGKTVSFGLQTGEFTARNVILTAGLPGFEILHNGAFFCKVQLSVPGRHNVGNALAAAAACFADGIPPEIIGRGLSEYAGAKRRFEYHCTVNGAVVADDYGHQPDAYAVTFRTARDLGFRRIIAIHQPHTFSRTKLLMDDFVKILSTVDKVLIPPIYAARETNDEYQVSSQDLVARLPNAEFVPDFEAIADRIKELAQPGDLFITLGCGDIYKAAERTAEKYGEKRF